MTEIESYQVHETGDAKRLLEKYPTRVPIILIRHHTCRPEVKIARTRFLIPRDLSFSSVNIAVRRRLNLSPQQSIFLFCQGSILPSSQTTGNVYNTYKDTDGFLYVYYTTENTFG